MHLSITTFFGIISAILISAALIPYFVSVVRGHTKPERAAAFIFSILTTISFFGQYASGAKASLWYALALMILQFILFGLSIKYGMGGYSRQDVISLTLAISILVAWYFTNSASLAIILVVIVNTIAKFLIALKAYRYPYTELLFTWRVSLIAGVFGILSVGSLNWILLLAPVQNVVTVAIIGYIITERRNVVKQPRKS